MTQSRLHVAPRFSASADVVLYHGDCLELLSEVPNEHLQLVVTSPPYNIGKQYEKKLDLTTYVEQQRRVIEECVRILHPSGSICWQVGNFIEKGSIIPLDIVLFPLFSDLGLKLRNRIVWHFEHGLHASKRFSGRYETILWFTKTDSFTFNLDPVRVPQKYPGKKHFKGPHKGELSGNPLGKNPGDVWIIPNVKANHIEKTNHPCQFPVELIERLVLALTNAGDTVLDPFLGVGTTIIAAMMHSRKALGAEIVRDYVDVARRRIDAATSGALRVRPRERRVFHPQQPTPVIPPKRVQLFEKPSEGLLELIKP